MKETRFESFASLRDSIAAMSIRTVETEVLRIAASVESGEDGADAIRSAVVEWLEDRAGERLPERAAERTFSWEGDRLRCETVRLEDGEDDLWAVRVEDGGENGASGSLANEIGVAGSGDAPVRLFARVLSSVGHAFGEAPDLIARLAERYELKQFGVQLGASPLLIKTERDAEALVKWLTHASRRLPVITLSVPDDAEDPYRPLLDPVELARDAAGIAQVAVLPSRFTWFLTQRFSKKLSVYRGAIRIYQPGFDGVNAGDSHWAVMADRLSTPAGAQRHRADILRRVGERSVADQEAPPAFADLRERAGGKPPPVESAGAAPPVAERGGVAAPTAEPDGAAGEEVASPSEVRAKKSPGDEAASPDLAATVGGRNAPADAADPAAPPRRERGRTPGAPGCRPSARSTGARTGSRVASETPPGFSPAAAEGGQKHAPAVRPAPRPTPGSTQGPPASEPRTTAERTPAAPPATPAASPERTPGWFARLGLLARMLGPGGYATEAARIRAPAEREKERMKRELQSSRHQLDELTTKLRSTREEAEYFLTENQEAEARAGKQQRRIDEAKARIAQLEEQLRSLGHTPLPGGWEDFVDWCERELGGSLILSPKARREIKGAHFADAPLAARCLLWLAGEYRDGRLNGAGASLRIEESGIRNEPCGGDKVPLKWRGENRHADWHLKNGGNTRDPARCLRIYYFWDQETRQVVVASMPAHVRSAIT